MSLAVVTPCDTSAAALGVAEAASYTPWLKSVAFLAGPRSSAVAETAVVCTITLPTCFF